LNNRVDVRIPVEGIELDAWLFIPHSHGKKHPAITMAHGFAGTKEHGLERFAKAFCNAGFIVLVHDHRGFGASGGELRQDVNPGQQIADWRRVITYLEALPEVNPQRIGIWGTSYSGGHAIILAATDRRLRCAVSQAPLIDGFEQLRRYMSPSESLALDSYLLEDERAQFYGNPPLTTTIASADPNISAIIRVQESIDFYLQPIPENLWENKVTLQSMRHFGMYNSGTWVSRVSPTPLLFVVPQQDILTATDMALAAYEQALEPKELILLAGNHTSAFWDLFIPASDSAIQWFRKHLMGSPDTA
jgi:uncharacterized protein